MRARDHSGWTALIWAAGVGHEAVVRLLIEHGAEPDVAADDGVTPLMRAARGGHIGIVHCLRAAGANALLRDRTGRTALDWAKEVGWDDPGVDEVLS